MNDYSFHQHGDMLYTASYGQGFLLNCSRFLYFLNETEYDFQDLTKTLISNFVLEGFRWICYKNQIDFATMGRAISRKEFNLEELKKACDYLVCIKAPNYKEIKAFRNSIDKSNNEEVIYGNKYFWTSDHMIQRNNMFYFSVRILSSRLLGSESGNGEGVLNYHLSDGSYMLCSSGNEYQNIFPNWNWKKIPGITNHNYKSQIPISNWGNNSKNNCLFSGGVSDCESGLMFMEYCKNGVNAKKFYYSNNNAIICMGTDIKSDSLYSLYTTVDQSLARRVKVDSLFAVQKNTYFRIKNNNINYFIPNVFNISVNKREDVSSWSKINLKYDSLSFIEKKRLLTIDINHTNSNKYNYIIIPYKAKKKKLKSIIETIEIIKNSSQVQCIVDFTYEKYVMVFYEPSILELRSNFKIHADTPCALILTKEEIYFNSFDHKSNPITLRILNNENKTIESFKLYSRHKDSKFPTRTNAIENSISTLNKKTSLSKNNDSLFPVEYF